MLYYQFAIMGDKVELDELEAWLKHIESQVVPDPHGYGSKWLGHILKALGQGADDCPRQARWLTIERCDDTALTIDMEVPRDWSAPPWDCWAIAAIQPNDVIKLLEQRWPSFSHYYYKQDPVTSFTFTNDTEHEYIPRADCPRQRRQYILLDATVVGPSGSIDMPNLEFDVDTDTLNAITEIYNRELKAGGMADDGEFGKEFESILKAKDATLYNRMLYLACFEIREIVWHLDSHEQYQEFRDKGIVIDVDCFGDMVEDFNPDATVKLNFTGWPRLVD